MRERRWPSFAGRKPSKKKRSVGRPATVSAASTAEGARQGGDAVAGFAGRPHQLEAGIGDERRAGVRHQRDGGACGEPRDELRPRLGGVVVVVGRERRGDAVMVDELAGDPRVLAGDQVGGGQHLQRPQGDVAQVADRGGDEMQAGRQRRGGDRLAVQPVGCGWPDQGLPAAGAMRVRMRGSLAVRSAPVISLGIHYPFHLVN